MKAVWSFWTKPFEAHHHSWWPSAKHHLLAWVLSLETARQHYPDTWLITDDAGARMLVDGIGLQFRRVSTELNALAQHDTDWWAAGKIYAYRMQTEPFVHIDNDVFLWKRLPARLERADVFAQNPESLVAATNYQPELLDRALSDAWLPDEWRWYQRLSKRQAYCCGILGGNCIDFINLYATASLRMIEDPANQSALQSLPNKQMHIVLVEQYLLSAFAKYHTSRPGSPFGRIEFECLFNTMDESQTPDYVARAGFTHLGGTAKKNGLFAERLENRVRRDYPEHYRRCVRYISAI
jgi:hypothetical protein